MLTLSEIFGAVFLFNGVAVPHLFFSTTPLAISNRVVAQFIIPQNYKPRKSPTFRWMRGRKNYFKSRIVQTRDERSHIVYCFIWLSQQAEAQQKPSHAVNQLLANIRANENTMAQ